MSEEACSCAKLQVPVRRRSGGVSIFNEPDTQSCSVRPLGIQSRAARMGQSWAIALSAQNRGCESFADGRWDTTEAPPRQADPGKIDCFRRVESLGPARAESCVRDEHPTARESTGVLANVRRAELPRGIGYDTTSRVSRCSPSMRRVLRLDRLRPVFQAISAPSTSRGDPPRPAARHRRSREQ